MWFMTNPRRTATRGIFMSVVPLRSNAQGLNKCSSFAPAIADLPRNGERLLVILDRLAHLAQRIVGVAEVAEMPPFAPAVTDLAGNRQRLLVILNRLAHLAQI